VKTQRRDVKDGSECSAAVAFSRSDVIRTESGGHGRNLYSFALITGLLAVTTVGSRGGSRTLRASCQLGRFCCRSIIIAASRAPGAPGVQLDCTLEDARPG